MSWQTNGLLGSLFGGNRSVNKVPERRSAAPGGPAPARRNQPQGVPEVRNANGAGSSPDGSNAGGGQGGSETETVESLRALRAKKVARMQTILDTAKAAKRAMDPEAQAAFDECKTDIRNLDSRVAALEGEEATDPMDQPGAEPQDAGARGAYEACIAQNSMWLDNVRNAPAPASRSNSHHVTPQPNRRSRPIPSGQDWGGGQAPGIVRDLNDQRFHESVNQAFRAFFLAGAGRVVRNQDWVRSAHIWGIVPGAAMEFDLREPSARDFESFYARETRDMSTSSSPLVPQTFLAKFVTAQLYVCPLRQYATVLTTTTGEQIKLPTANDTASKGERLAENTITNTDGSSLDVANLAAVSINAAQYSSKPLKMSIALFEDSAIPVEAMAGKITGDRIGRIQCDDLTLGDRTSGAPEGIVYGANAGATAASSTVLALDDLVGHYYKLDPAYRNSPNFVWMANDATLAALSKLKDSNNQSMSVFGRNGNFRDGTIETILGKAVVPNNSMVSSLTTGVKAMILGDLSTYHIRDVRGISLQVLKERYAEYFEVGFLAGQRTDGIHTDKTSIKHLSMA